MADREHTTPRKRHDSTAHTAGIEKIMAAYPGADRKRFALKIKPFLDHPVPDCHRDEHPALCLAIAALKARMAEETTNDR